MNNWIYQGREYNPPKDFTPNDLYGFVYCITNRATNRKYIGKKFFWKAKTLPITKTRKRRKKLLVESDWKDYYGSHKDILKLLKEGDPMDFERRILCYVPNKKLLTYFECKYLFINEVLETRNDYINDNILGKFYRKDFLNETK